MNIFTMMYQNSKYRKSLEKQALLSICSCLYYDIADNVALATEQELLDIINHSYECEMCGLTKK